MNEILQIVILFFLVSALGLVGTSVWLFLLGRSVDHAYGKTLERAAHQTMLYARNSLVMSAVVLLLRMVVNL